MPYVGRDLQRGNYLKLDDISSSFDGSRTTFNLTSGGNAFFPGSAFSIIVSLGGVVQEPESAFQIDKSQIIFAQAPTPNDDFFCIVQGVALGVGVPGHNTVGDNQLAKPLSYSDYFRWDSTNNRVGINTLLPSVALDVIGDASFSGNVAIGGTLTYEDVANIDAVGLITARAGIEDKTLTQGRVVFVGSNSRLSDSATLTYDGTSLVSPQIIVGSALTANSTGINVSGVSTFNDSVFFPNNKKLKFGNTAANSYTEIFHSPSDNFTHITANGDNAGIGGTIRILGNHLSFAGKTAAGATQQFIFCDGDNAGIGTGNVNLYQNNDRKFRTISNGAQVESATGDTYLTVKAEENNSSSDSVVRISTASTQASSYLQFGDGDSGSVGQIRYRHDTNSLICGVNANSAFIIDSDRQLSVPTAPSSGIGKFNVKPGSDDEYFKIRDAGDFDSNYNGVALDISNSANNVSKDLIIRSNELILRQAGSGEKVRVNSAGFVGLGTTNPGAKLHLYGTDTRIRLSKSNAGANLKHWDIAAQGEILRLQAKNDAGSGSGNLFDFYRSGNQINEFRGMKAGNYWFVISNEDKKVGVGTTNPNTEFEVFSDTFADITVGSARTSGNIGGLNFRKTNPGGSHAGIMTAQYFVDTSGSHFFHSQGSERLKIASDGDLTIRGSDNAELKLRCGTSTGNNIIAFLNSSGTTKGNIFYDSDNNFMVFKTDGTASSNERIRITSTGEVGINVIPSNGQMLAITGRSGYDDIVQVTAVGTNMGARINLTNTGTGVARINATNNDLELQTTGISRLLIKADGKAVFSEEIETPQDYPNFRPTIDFNFAAEKKLDPRITYERTGPASFVNEFGKVVLVGGNVPRFDHDPTTRESKGLLIEEDRININAINTFRRSSNGRFGMNSADEQNAGENTNGVVSPVGTAKGVARAFFTGNESDPNGSVYVMASTSASDGAIFTNTNTYTSSVWIRTGLETVFRMDAHSQYASASAGGSADTISFTFTLTGDGTVTTIESGGISATVTKFPNNWYRCTATFHRNSTSSVTSPYGVIIYAVNYSSYNANSQTGDIAWFWGPQVEEGSFPSSYIPTYGSTATRGDDIVRIMDDDFTDIFGTEFENFSVVADFDNSNSLDGNSASILEWWSDDNNYENRIQIFKDNSSPYHIELRAISNNIGIFANDTLSASSKAASNRFATSWSVDYSTSNAANRRWAFSFSGEEVDVVGDNTSTAVPTLTRFGIGCSPRLLNFTRGTLLFKRLMVYNQTLSDNQLRTLSA